MQTESQREMRNATELAFRMEAWVEVQEAEADVHGLNSLDDRVEEICKWAEIEGFTRSQAMPEARHQVARAMTFELETFARKCGRGDIVEKAEKWDKLTKLLAPATKNARPDLRDLLLSRPMSQS